jgi:predicted GIY-YIG superfamily endonuclease
MIKERRRMAFWVYMLKCRDGSFYTGHTDDLEKRLWQHETGIGCSYTRKRRPVSLVYSESFNARIEALASERQIKGWCRKKKEALIRGDWTEISRLSKMHGGKQ